MIWSPKALRSAGSSALVRLASNEDRFWSESLSRPHADSASGRARAAVRVNSFAIMPEGSFSRGEPRQRMVKISLESEMIVVLPLALPRRQAHLCCMFSILASIIGFIALLLMIPPVLPFLGWANCLIVPLALLGAVIGILSSSNVGRNFCLIVAALGVFRLFIGDRKSTRLNSSH